MTDRLALHGVFKSFGGLHVNSDVSFALKAGDRVALIGPNGAGKTTLVNIISGDLRPTAGRVLFEGADVTRLPIAERSRRGLARTFQISRLFASLTAGENVSLAVMQRRGLTRRVLSATADMADVHTECIELLETLGIADLAALPVGQLAYGQQRLLELAIGIALKPKVLLLDEPAAGVPHEETPKILGAIDRLPPDIAVLMIEHDMDLVFRFARRVLVLAGGRLIFEGTPAEASLDEDVRRAYLGSYADARRTA
ncbi:ABC transporter ATP-binding protein [Chelatococcus reniformis]|uniref:ABC transporter ATP-binding protein n=1 Tax=Chelatococcus reniformis TaxID=1494448 RepID=A0A916UBJ9_9HYPH|nr:ABC transporter ATP-binding protein [Chelatococcus reniformis]GGC67614.1 ABC transporter ATP-binding protein [Chelatococcus reniformis]